MQVIPSVLENNTSAFLSQIKRLSPHFNTFQIDIADGIFVPNKTIQIEDIEKTIQQFNNLAINQLIFDFHLMVKDYETEVKKLNDLAAKKLINIKNVFIHFSLSPNYSLLTTAYPQLTFGLVLNPEESLDKLYKLYNFKTIKCIQIMSVNPGFQGSPFIPQTLKKVEQLHLQHYRNKIYLDGAINQDTLPLVLSLKNKPDYLCVGSFLSKAENLKELIEYLREKIG